MRRKSADYKREVKDEPFELELEATTGKGANARPVVVAFTRPSTDLPMEIIDAFSDYSAGAMSPRERQLRYQLGDDDKAYEAFWAEWKKKPRGALDDLINDVDAYFSDGVDAGKALSSVG